MQRAHLEKIGVSVQTLRDKLPLTTEGVFDTGQLGTGITIDSWKIVEAWKRKITVINKRLKIFAKLYTTDTGDYSFLIFQCLHELSSLVRLPLPVLKPIANIHQANIFEMGEPLREIPVTDIYNLEQLRCIESVILRFGFLPSHPSQSLSPLAEMLDVVQIGRNRFLVDPVNDLPIEISRYVRK